MKKSNIRSMRFSDEILELIEAQAGINFTAKFEALVTRCCWELPSKERELAELEEKILYVRFQFLRRDEIFINREITDQASAIL